MQDSLWRILLLLVSAKVSPADIERLVEYARTENPHKLLEAYQQLRAEMRELEHKIQSEEPRFSPRNDRPLEILRHDIYYLIKRAGVPLSQAARATSIQLSKRHPEFSRRELAFAPKDRFDDWLDRVANRVGEQAVLRAASIALDTIKKGPKTDWPLTSS